jgi:hypothetical protein
VVEPNHPFSFLTQLLFDQVFGWAQWLGNKFALGGSNQLLGVAIRAGNRVPLIVHVFVIRRL